MYRICNIFDRITICGFIALSTEKESFSCIYEWKYSYIFVLDQEKKEPHCSDAYRRSVKWYNWTRRIDCIPEGVKQLPMHQKSTGHRQSLFRTKQWNIDNITQWVPVLIFLHSLKTIWQKLISKGETLLIWKIRTLWT